MPLVGMGLVPWNVIAAGRLRPAAGTNRRIETGDKGRMLRGRDWQQSETERKASNALETVANELGGDISVSAGSVFSLTSKQSSQLKCVMQSRLPT